VQARDAGSVNAAAVVPVKGSGATPAISAGAVKLISVEAVSAACAGEITANPSSTTDAIFNAFDSIFTISPILVSWL
jgi:hypothetical protein